MILRQLCPIKIHTSEVMIYIVYVVNIADALNFHHHRKYIKLIKFPREF